MGTSASTQQDVSQVTHSNIQSQSLPSITTSNRSIHFGNLPISPQSLDHQDVAAILQQATPPSSDGYKWRKYGQKSVKGSDYPRSYYKCTYPGCSVKKYVEKYEEDGKVVERVSYKGGEHSHDPSRVTRVNAADQNAFKRSVLSESFGQDMMIKAEQSELTETESSQVTTTTITFPASPRLVVETTADVDHNDDGYTWRKYGQKTVKGTSPYPTPRSYYRCTQEDCPVKKQVEQRGNTIYNTYEGTHTHLAPGLDESGVKKKRKLNRSSISLGLGSSTEQLKPKLETEVNGGGELTEKHHLSQEDSEPKMEESLVIPDPNGTNERNVIPLQELNTHSDSVHSSNS